MKIVIDIPEQKYRSIQECAVAVTDEILKAVLNGTPYVRKTGRWRTRSRKLLSTRNDRFYWRECSVCRWCREDCNKANDTPYCPNCGAKMERSRR